MRALLRLLTLLALSATFGLPQAARAEQGGEPADRHASAATRTVLKFLRELPARKERKIISGQFPEWYPRATLDSFRELEKTTGHMPGILSLDYFETFLDDDQATSPVLHKPARWQTINPLLVEHWRAGGLVTLSVHMTNPWSGKKAWDRSGDLQELVEGGKPTEILRKVLAPIADGLADLQRQGVVVMFRPYHELTLQSTFWWSGKDDAAFQDLWRATFHYFTGTRQLHNLLWVFNPNSGCGPRAMEFYPGDQFVDLVSLDLYSVDFAKEVENYKLLVKTGKPFALSEFGPGHVPFSADTFANATLGYDYGEFDALLLKHFPETVFYVAWRGPFSLNKNLNAEKLLGSPASVNLLHLRKELSPRLAAGESGESDR
jgi:mannan endo-1,4-beta-mannosidase